MVRWPIQTTQRRIARCRMTELGFLHNTFSCPNFLIDEVMPTLKDTEWRLLCVVLRQTRGWVNASSKERKVWDWLSQSQLRKRTGRNTGALSKALDALVRRDLVVVQDGTGKRLSTPQERRRANCPLFYALGPAGAISTTTGSTVCNSTSPPSNGALSTALFQQPALQNPSPCRAKSERTVSTAAHRKLFTVKSAVRKAHTTKATDTKLNTKGFEKRTAAEYYEPERYETETDSAADAQTALPIDSDPAVLRFVQTYQELYRGQFGTSALSALPKDIRRLSEALVGHSEAELTKLMAKFFTADIGYVKRHGYSLSAFLATLNILKVMRPK